MIREKVQEDLKAAMRERNQFVINTLRGYISELKNEEINTRQPLTEAREIEILQKEIKKRRDAIDFAKTASREDLITQNLSEIDILQKYLGEQISEEKLKELITALIAAGENNIGKIMGALNKDHKGKFEGKVASELIKSLLSPS
jgi:uncharacterized protein YqeY